MEPFVFIFVFVIVAVASYFLTQHLDRSRVHDYLRSRGEELLDFDWALVGPGWLGERDSRIYLITYRDRSGKVHRAFAKTSMLSGVYFTDDTVVGGDKNLPAIRDKLRRSWLKRKAGKDRQ